MKRWWILLCLLSLAMLFSAQAPKQEEKPLFVPGEFIVKFKAEAPALAMTATVAPVSGNIYLLKTGTGAEVAKISGAEVAQAVPAVDTTQIEYIEPNYLYYASETPNDPRFGDLWGLHNTGQTGGRQDADIDAPEAWDITKGSADIIVGVIDTGVDYNHPDLAANIWNNPGETGTDANGNDKKTNGIDDDGNNFIDDWRGWDFVNNDNNPMDDNAHGTHCSGTIGAVGNDGVGVVGVNWNVRIMPLKFLRADGSGSLDAAIRAIDYASHFGVQVTNNSWGGGGRSQALEEAIERAHAAGSLFVAAAGNSGNNNDTTPNYPSNYEVPNVLAVAAIDHEGNLANFGSGGGGGICGCDNVLPSPGSNYGATTVDLGAPGKNILSTTPNNGYQAFQGTSMATPHVAGVAALTLSRFPNLTTEELKQRLMDTVQPSAGLNGRVVTGGIVNAFNAVSGQAVAP